MNAEQQTATLKTRASYLTNYDLFSSVQIQTGPQGQPICICSLEDNSFQAVLSCPNSQLVTVDIICQGENFASIDRQAASALCARVNNAYRFQQMMLVVDHDQVLSEAQIVTTAPEQGFAGCVSNIMELTRAVKNVTKHLSAANSPYSETQIEGLLTLVGMDYGAATSF